MGENFNIEKYAQEVNAMMDNAIKNFEKEANAMENNNNVEVTAMTDNTNNNTEAETMTDSTNNNTEAEAMTDSTNNSNMEAADMMANRTEERAETTETSLPPTVATANIDVMAYLIDEDERALDNESVNTIQNALMKIDQSPILGMGNIQNILGGRLYGLIYENSKGFRFIDFCQRYHNGAFSPRMRVSQDGLMTTAMYEMNSQIGQPSNGVKRKISQFKSEMHKEYLGKFRGNVMEIIPVDEIVKGLATALPLLPVISDDERILMRIEFYNRVRELAKSCQSQMIDNFKSYYALTDEDITYIAGEFKQNRLSFLRELKEYNLLYLTNSSNGYQVNVRCRYGNETTTEWRYCILKLSHLTGEDDEPEGVDLHSF